MKEPKEINGIRIPDIPSLIDDMLVRGNEQYPARNVWASSVGHPCMRRLVYEQLAWRCKPNPDAGLLRIFALGRLHGKQIFRDLEDALEPNDVRVEQSEVRVPENEWGISGKVDAILGFPNPEGGRRINVPCEIKSAQAHMLSKLYSVDDLWNSDRVYHRQYAGQLLSYIHLLGAPFGIFYFREKATGKDRQLIMMPDEERWRIIRSRAAKVNLLAREIRTSTTQRNREAWSPEVDRLMPPRVPWSSMTCGQCPFLHICVPDMAVRDGVADYMGDEEANDCVKRLNELKPASAEHSKLNEKLKKFCSAACFDLQVGESRVLALPDYDVTVKVGERRQLDLPVHLKEKHTVKKRQYINKITDAGTGEDKGNVVEDS